MTANGATAEAVLPAVDFSGTQPTTLNVDYSAAGGGYDWSYPATAHGRRGAEWQVPVVPAVGSAGAFGLTGQEMATGIIHTAQSRDAEMTLIAGVLLGIGGGAVVAGLQEALHD